MKKLHVKFLDLAKINNRFETQIKEKFSEIIKNGIYINGSENESFCNKFANFCGVKYCVGVANGLDAINLILKAQGFSKDDEIIVPANTFIATILAISENCTPVLVEPSLNTYNLDPNKIEKHITDHTKAIFVVHLYGRVAEFEKISSIAKKYNLKIFEDCAQVHGAKYNDRSVGSLSNAGAFSFYPGKNLGCFGDGGAVVTDDLNLYKKVKALSNYGSDRKYHHIFKGVNSRLDELQAAVLNIKLDFLVQDNEIRRKIADFYLSNIDNSLLILPKYEWEQKERNVWHIFPIRCERRDELKDYLYSKGIETLIHYPTPPHKQLAYKEWNNLVYPISEEIHRTELSIPISPVMTDEEIEYVVKVLNNFH